MSCEEVGFSCFGIVAGCWLFFWMKWQSNPESQVTKVPEPKMSIDRVPVKVSPSEIIEEAPVVDELGEEAEKVLWAESDLAKEVLHENGHLPVDLNGETYLELDVKMLRNLEVGDYVDISLPGIEEEYDAQVGGIEQHASGNKSVQLNFPGLTRLHGATFTLGKNSVYAQLNTPAGSYTLEAQDGYAWIAPNGALIQNHVEKHDEDMSSESPREKTWNDSEVLLNDFE